MPAGKYNFTCEQGAQFSKRLTVTNARGPVDFSGFSAEMHVRTRIGNTNYTVNLSTANGRIVLGGAAGTIDLTIPSVDTATIPRSGVYDIEITDLGGEVHRLLQGQFVLDREVTR